jgi:predicted ArsR family transcriptional regulator
VIGIGLGESQQRILEHLKRHGAGTIPAIAADLGLNVETVRAHLRSLGGEGLVRRAGRRPKGPGRPEIVYELTGAAEALFPQREGQVLQELVRHLEASGQPELVHTFFEAYVDRRRSEALARVRDLEGERRLEEVARILTEEGFMAELDVDDAGRRVLRLCHCPLRGLVRVTRVPCRAELGFVRDLLGEELARVSYIPSGDAACSYTLMDD